MILTVTINPAVDKSTSLEKMIPEKKLRCEAPVVEAGGGGINVSKAVHELGGDTIAIFPAGGANGALLERLLGGRQIPYKTIPVAGETRENITVTELSKNAQYRFVMPGGALTTTEVDQCLSEVNAVQPAPQIIVASGSLPPGAPEDFFATLARMAKEKNAKLIVDTSGIPLQRAAKEGVYLLKPNLSELCSLVGKDYLQLDEVADAARQVISMGYCKVLVASMGPSGALLISDGNVDRVPAPIVKKVSTVGAGDCMVAGIAYMLEQERPLAEVLRFGVACGTAATMRPGTGLFQKPDVYRLYEWLKTV
jgi:6-phosphofructokinase 2